MPRRTTEETLRSRSVRDRSTAAKFGGEGCQIWTGAINNSGYGTIRVQGTMRLVHVVAFEHFVRPLQLGEKVCHECDQSLCWEPLHLRAKTQRENMRDCLLRGRLSAAKVTLAQVGRVRGVEERTRVSAQRLAAELGVSPRTIWRIWSGTTWRTLPEAAA